MKSLFAIFLPLVIAKPSSLEMRAICSSINRNDCLNDWGCMWCNNTETCHDVRVCHFNQSENYSCELSNYDYKSECYFFNWLFFGLVIFGFISAIIILLYINSKILQLNNINSNLVNRIQILITSLIVIPFILLYFCDYIVFYYYLFSIIVFSLLYSCCFSSSMSINYYRQNTQNSEQEKLIQ